MKLPIYVHVVIWAIAGCIVGGITHQLLFIPIFAIVGLVRGLAK